MLSYFFPDRRKRQLCKIRVLLTFVSITWFSITAVAQSTLTEHAKDLIPFQWWIITLLGGGCFTVMAYLYTQNVKAQKEMHRSNVESINELRKELKEYAELLHELHAEHNMIIKSKSKLCRIDKGINHDPNAL